MIDTIHLACGLPGSGKSSLLKSIPDSFYIDLDNIRSKNLILEKLNSGNINYSNISTVAIDILLLDKDQINNFLLLLKESNAFNGFFSRYYSYIYIHYWEPDREACLKNNSTRSTERNADITIKHSHCSKPDIAWLKKIYFKQRFYLKEHIIVNSKTEKIINFFKEYDLNVDISLIYTSSSWSLGGTYGNCWNGSKYTVDPETPPTSFEELDNILGEICPNLTFMQYKFIENNFVSIKTKSEGDYYGGSTTNAWYQVNIRDLYNYLVQQNLIKENEI